MKILQKIKSRIWSHYFKNARLSFSQSGEDMILDTIFCDISNGTYVDVGANNPFIQSNTHYFYRKGWQGVNIDALPGSMNLFNKIRPRDINIEAAISSNETELTYYMFKSSFYNTFSDNDIEKIKKVSEFLGSKNIKTIRLENVFENLNLLNIEFLSIDVEGLDFDVIKSNNWNKFRPKVIVTEFFSKETEFLGQDKVFNFLKENGYRYYCSSATNAFYIENNFFKHRFENL